MIGRKLQFGTPSESKQREAMRIVYQELGLVQFIDRITDECNWCGVECDEFCVVRGININNKIPNNCYPYIHSYIGRLEYLETIQMRNNRIFGTIPTEMGLLEDLEVVDLQNNNLSGSLPTELGLLNDLLSLNVEQNKLSKTLPTEYGLLSTLNSVSLKFNDFSGVLPSEWNDLTGASIDVSHNPSLGGNETTALCARDDDTFLYYNTQINCTASLL